MEKDRQETKKESPKFFGHYVKEERNTIEYEPKNEEEKLHIRKLRELLYLKRRGDWQLVAEIIGTSAVVAEKSFVRVHSAKHIEAVEALDAVVENRQKLLDNIKTKTV